MFLSMYAECAPRRHVEKLAKQAGKDEWDFMEQVLGLEKDNYKSYQWGDYAVSRNGWVGDNFIFGYEFDCGHMDYFLIPGPGYKLTEEVKDTFKFKFFNTSSPAQLQFSLQILSLLPFVQR